MIRTHSTQRIAHNAKGVSLIIVIFAMMLFAVLGWTLAVMLSTDFEANLRNLDSERALGLAEAGSQWALNQLSQSGSWRTGNGDSDCDDSGDWLSPHSLAPGQYSVCCRNPCSSPPCGSVTVVEGGDAVIESTGYIPTQASYRAMRQVKIVVVLGGNIDKVVGCRDLFDWSAAKAAHTVTIDGDISAPNYNGDGNGTYNQTPPAGQDYNPSVPLLPPGSGARAIASVNNAIPMQWYHDNADCEWPPNPETNVITNTADNATSGTTLKVSNPVNFFTRIPNTRYQAVRNIDVPTLPSGAWNDTGWAVIIAVTDGRTVTVDRDVTAWKGQRIRLARRYASGATATPAPESGRNDNGGPGSGINYIGANITHAMGYPVDVVIDLRSNPLGWQDVKIICEGDIFIKGSRALTMTHSASGGAGGHRHPPLATQNGNIICLDATTQNDRTISGLIFSETGTVNWNYLRYPTSGGASWLRGNMIYGQNIILDGDITMDWLPALDPSELASFGAASGEILTWQEQ